MNKSILINGVHQSAYGIVQCFIVEKGIIVREFPPVKNLILNQGLDGLCTSRGWGDSFTHAVVGTGQRATYGDSGSGVTGSGVAGSSVGTFTCPSGFNFQDKAASGDMLVMTSGNDSGVEVMIQSVVNATTVTYTPNRDLATGEFRVYSTSQTQLETEVKRTNTYLTGTGNCGTTLSGNVVQMKRTYDFTEESAPVTYYELGFSWTNTAGANLFSRVRLPSGISLDAGQQLRVVYELYVALSPTTPQSKTFNITGWPVLPATTTSGVEQIQQVAITTVDTAGAATNDFTFGTRNVLEPYVTTITGGLGDVRIWVSSTSTAIPTFPGTVSRTALGKKAVALGSYTPRNFYRDISVTFLTTEANGTVRSMGFGREYTGNPFAAAEGNGCAFACLFDQNQTKDSLYSLTLTFRRSVGRVLAP